MLTGNAKFQSPVLTMSILLDKPDVYDNIDRVLYRVTTVLF
jgi:hypothetical protein